MDDLIEEALKDLDPENDQHWTQTGLPRLEVLQNILGGSVTRDELNSKFTRDKARAAKKVSNEESTSVTNEDSLETSEDAKENADTEDSSEDSTVDLKDSAEITDDFSVTVETSEKEEKEEKIEALQERIKVREETIRKMQGNFNKLKTNLDRASKGLSQLNDELEALQPKTTNGENIATYIKSQTALRVKKHAQAQEVLQSLEGRSLNHKSPLDAALNARANRQSKRPQRI